MPRITETAREVILAVLPVTAVVTFLQFTVLWLPVEIFLRFLWGTLLITAGLLLFFLGIHIGFLPLGERIGGELSKTGKLSLIVLFGFLLGFTITVAEPDVRVLALQVELVSEGTISRFVLIFSVGLGVAAFFVLAILRIIYRVSLLALLIGGYALVFLLAAFAPPHFFPVSFDAGGVTTGPLTVPFILSLGVGVASLLRGSSPDDSFGLVALSSIGPILSVLILGMVY